MLTSNDEAVSLGGMSFSLASDIVELVVLTTDEAFLKTLRDAVGGSRRLWHVPTADKVSDLLVAGQVGILVLDVVGLNQPANLFLSQIKHQFPDLVIVAAGKRESETALAGLISTGIVYRFIHKPMSPGRAKLFADAAVRKYEEQRRRSTLLPTAVTGSRRQRRLVIIGVLIAFAGIVALTILRGGPPRPRAVEAVRMTARPKIDDSMLAQAAAALADNRLTTPRRENALDLYLQALARDPANGAAKAGLAEVRERLLASAENALLEERLDETSTAIETARKAGADGSRIALMTSQLAKARGQLKSATAQVHYPNTHADKPGVEDEQITRDLDLAARRIQEDQLIEPDRDNARFFVQEALRIDPDSHAAQTAQENFAIVLLSAARTAIERRDFAHAVSLLDAANGIAAPVNVENLLQLMRTARRQAETDSREQLPKTIQEPPRQDRASEQPVSPPIVNAGELTIVKSVRPIYPRKALQNKIEGWVAIEFTVTVDGAVRDVQVLSATPAGIFDGAALDALSQWRYLPVLQDAKPVAQRARIRIRFVMSK